MDVLADVAAEVSVRVEGSKYTDTTTTVDVRLINTTNSQVIAIGSGKFYVGGDRDALEGAMRRAVYNLP